MDYCTTNLVDSENRIVELRRQRSKLKQSLNDKKRTLNSCRDDYEQTLKNKQNLLKSFENISYIMKKKIAKVDSRVKILKNTYSGINNILSGPKTHATLDRLSRVLKEILDEIDQLENECRVVQHSINRIDSEIRKLEQEKLKYIG